MKKIYYLTAVLILLVGCTGDFTETVDFTKVVNPNLSEESVVGQPNSSSILLKGIERQMSITLNSLVVISELGSDNYENTQTFFSQFMDNLDIRVVDPAMRTAQGSISTLRELAKFGLEKVGPNDPSYTEQINAEYHFFEGMSYLYAAMYFSNLPQEPVGPTVDSKKNYESAIASFDKAIALFDKPEYNLAKARANYYLGNKAEAISAAQKSLDLNTEFLRDAKFDQKDGPANTMESALYARATFDDLQPLPSLDFLDPKYSFLTPDLDPSIYYLKAEEAYLIIAEANVGEDLSKVKNSLKDLLTVVSKREIRVVDETTEQRSQVDVGSRPNKSNITVDGRSGLVLDRTVSTSVPSVSGTSLNEVEIDNLINDDDILEKIYRTRQEIFMAEGIRLVDMGIKLVLSEEEIVQNPNILENSPGTIPVIPSFIDNIKNDLDAFTFDKAKGEVKLKVNLNKVLVNNKTSSEVLPFN